MRTEGSGRVLAGWWRRQPPLQSSGTDMVVDSVQHGQSSYMAALLYQLVTAAIDLAVGKYIQADF